MTTEWGEKYLVSLVKEAVNARERAIKHNAVLDSFGPSYNGHSRQDISDHDGYIQQAEATLEAYKRGEYPTDWRKLSPGRDLDFALTDKLAAANLYFDIGEHLLVYSTETSSALSMLADFLAEEIGASLTLNYKWRAWVVSIENEWSGVSTRCESTTWLTEEEADLMLDTINFDEELAFVIVRAWLDYLEQREKVAEIV